MSKNSKKKNVIKTAYSKYKRICRFRLKINVE